MTSSSIKSTKDKKLSGQSDPAEQVRVNDITSDEIWVLNNGLLKVLIPAGVHGFITRAALFPRFTTLSAPVGRLGACVASPNIKTSERGGSREFTECNSSSVGFLTK